VGRDDVVARAQLGVQVVDHRLVVVHHQQLVLFDHGCASAVPLASNLVCMPSSWRRRAATSPASPSRRFSRARTSIVLLRAAAAWKPYSVRLPASLCASARAGSALPAATACASSSASSR